jgi:endonuclease YncB( thermonuclease family)
MRASLKRLFPFLIILSFALSLHAQETVRVLRVVDGDTLKFNYKGKEESLRLIGLDAPGTLHPMG